MEWKGLDIPPDLSVGAPGAAVGPSGRDAFGECVLLLMLLAAAKGLLPHTAAWQTKPAGTTALAPVTGS